MRKKYATRSLTEVPGWIALTCQRCAVTFWSVPAQAEHTLFCSKDCRHEDPMTRLLKNATTNEQGCLLFAGGVNDDGYGNIKYQGEQWRTHRLSWHLQVGPIPEGLLVLHKCIASRRCVLIGHLYLGTDADNTLDRMEQGRNVKSFILSEDDVRKVRLLKGVQTAQQTAIQFSVAPSTIYNVWLGFNRADVSC